MTEITSINWDKEVGYCKKHNSQFQGGGTCSKCMSEQDEDIQVFISSSEKEIAEMELEYARANGDDLEISYFYMLPSDHEHWLKDRIM